MDKEKLKQLTKEELQKKEKNTKSAMVWFVVLLLALAFFSLKDYQMDASDAILLFCPLGGLASLFYELKPIQEELASR